MTGTPHAELFPAEEDNKGARKDFCAELRPKIDTSDAIVCRRSAERGMAGSPNGSKAEGSYYDILCIVARKALASIPC